MTKNIKTNGSLVKNLANPKNPIIKNKKNKTMKAFTFLSILSMMILISSCSSKPKDEKVVKETIVSPDSLIGIWNTAWSSTDSITVSKIFTDDAQVVFSSEERIIGKDSIMTNWVNKNLPMVRNLKTDKYISSATEDMVYYSGSYSLDIVREDSVIGSDIGCFTTIWRKQEDNNWKIELMFFGKNKK